MSQSILVAPNLPASFTNGVGMEFMHIPAGNFMMGSPTSEVGRYSDERRHRVTIGYDFYLGKYPVTQGEWAQVMGNSPSRYTEGGARYPVEQVSWDAAQQFTAELNARKDGWAYRLPSEAEWEYACRAGTTTAYAFGDSLDLTQANFRGYYPYETKHLRKSMPVGSYAPNAWGLYDMHGNISEWCEDEYVKTYSKTPKDGSALAGVGISTKKVIRGGDSGSDGRQVRSPFRAFGVAYSKYDFVGVRVAAQPR